MTVTRTGKSMRYDRNVVGGKVHERIRRLLLLSIAIEQGKD